MHVTHVVLGAALWKIIVHAMISYHVDHSTYIYVLYCPFHVLSKYGYRRKVGINYFTIT